MGLLRRIAESRAARGLAVVAGLGAGIAGCNEELAGQVGRDITFSGIGHNQRMEEAVAGKPELTTPITVMEGGSQPRQYREVKWEEVDICGKTMMGFYNNQGLFLVPYGDPLNLSTRFSVRSPTGKWLELKEIIVPPDNRDLYNFRASFGQ